MPFSFYDRQHIQKMLANEDVIASIFNEFVTSVSPDLKKWGDTGKTNVWIRNARIEKAVERKLLSLQTDLAKVINEFQQDAWTRSNLKNDKLAEEYIKGMALSETIKKGLFAPNRDVLKEFQQRKEDGMDLSGRIWNLAGQTKTQLEFYLESGLSVGRSAAVIGQDIRQILKEPDRRFHRVKDAKGNLVLSQPMKNYHPGQGQYRSSTMNAKRVAVTETNMMYRKADSARWSQMDFVVGIHIARSSSKNKPCGLCDPLCGDYPKGFVYVGFHPFCVCIATPILLEPDEFAEYLHTDQIPEERIVRDVPPAAKDFIESIREQAKGWADMPYFIKDNIQFFGPLEVNTYSGEEKKFTRARSTREAMQRTIAELHKMYPEISNTQLAAIHHYTKSGGNYRQLNKQLANDVLSGFSEASAKLISDGLKDLPKYKGLVYRGTIIKRDLFQKLYSGSHVRHQIFTSATQDVNIAWRFSNYRPLKKNEVSVIFEINGQNGRDISPISEFNGIFRQENQKEILFDRDTPFEISSVKEQDGLIYISLKEL